MNLRRVAGRIFVVAALIFLALALVGQREELAAFDWEIAPGPLVASTLVLIGVLAGGVAIWGAVLRRFGVWVRFLTLARIWFLSSLGRYIPGKVWQFVGVAGMSRATAIPALVGITSLLVYMAIVLLAAIVVGVYLLPAPAAGPLAGFVVSARIVAPAGLLLLHPRLLDGAMRIAARVLRRPIAKWRGSWGDGIALFLACVVQWLGFGLAFYLFLSSQAGLVTIADFPALTAVYALAFAIGYLAFIAPAGFGAKEGAIVVLLVGTLSIPIGVATALAVAARIWSIVGDVLPALALLRAPHGEATGPAAMDSPEASVPESESPNTNPSETSRPEASSP